MFKIKRRILPLSLAVMGIKEYFFNPKKRQIYVEALSQNVPDVTQLGTTVATSDDLLKAAAPSVR